MPVLALVPGVPAHAPAVAVKRTMAWFQRVKTVTTSTALPAPGLYHFTENQPGENSRIHLRIDPDGSGILLVNANRSYHLNPSAAYIAYLILNKLPEAQAVKALMSNFRVQKKSAETDFHTIQDQLTELIRPDGACPICDLDLEITAPFSSKPSAPYRMDLALTYRCNNDCSHCYNDKQRAHQELSTADWIKTLDKLWEIGIPHIIFTGGEPTLRDDLPDLIRHAEQNGQITGINTNGRRLSDRSYLDSLVNAGLDHVQITLESHDSLIHNKMVQNDLAWLQTVEGIRNAVNSRLYIMTNTTLLQSNAESIMDTLHYLSELDVPTVGLNALIYSGRGANVNTGLREEALPALLTRAREITQQHNQKLIWYTPTQYCHFDPVQLELGVKGCTAALYNMCIEPDGSVIPCQSYYSSLGNFLEQPWSDIWEHPLARQLRDRSSAPDDCKQCSYFPECGGGCPLARHHCQPIAVSYFSTVGV
ncbi:MAG TPA: radical SAM protein [Longilinea sp.]|nr:radical SAM protein [Longilinea sp.]